MGTSPIDFEADDFIRMRRSANGGASFGPVVTIGVARHAAPSLDCAALAPVTNGNLRVIQAANIATDALVDGIVYAVWHSWDPVGQSMEVLFSRSTESGAAATWSTPVRLNDVAVNDQFFPRLATQEFPSVPPASQVRVIWYDRRHDPNNVNFDVYAANSTDAGQSWYANGRLTTATLDLPQLSPNFDCKRSICYFGSYNALTDIRPSDPLFLAAWGDTRNMASGDPCANPSCQPGICPYLPASSPDPDVRVRVGC
jgi:hypothetical protein